MSTQSLKWEQLPMQWNEGAFLGNGRIGMMIYVDSLDNSLTLWLSRPDVTDHRMAPQKKTSLGIKGASVMTDYCRMDIGKMKIFPEAEIISGTMELDIYNALLYGVINTDKGDIKIKAFTPYNQEINIIELETDIPLRWKQEAGSPRSPRIQVFPHLKESLKYEDNPNPIQVSKENEGWSVHPLLAGGDYATYWKCIKKKNIHILYISTKNEVPVDGLSLEKARKEVNMAIKKGNRLLINDMKKWWNNYYKTGIINIPDKKMENFYHIQLYKLATCSHPDGPVMDNFGTFYKTSQWPGIWWNLNVQLTYMSTLATNRLFLGENYQKLLDCLFTDIMHAYGSARCGDFAWALHTYYSHLLYEGADWNEMKCKIMPKATELLKFYLPHLKEENGVIHLLDTESPEYEGFKTYDNSNYNLGALRWLLQTMIQICDNSRYQPEDYPKWKYIIEKLHPYPVNENGFMIGSNKPFAKSHRHYSHLLSFYPLRIQDTTLPDVNRILEKSIDHWMNIGNGKGLAGYSYTGAASLYAFQGNGNKAYDRLFHFLNKPIGISLLLPNTFYVESDGKNPVIETPLSAATAITEMLIQGWGNTIRVFPAIPDNWQDCSFDKLRTEGAFVVSASRRKGQTEWIKIKNEGNCICRIYMPEWNNIFIAGGYKKPDIENKGNGYYNITIPKGETVILTDKKSSHVHKAIVIPNKEESNYYGVKRNKGLYKQMDWPKYQ